MGKKKNESTKKALKMVNEINKMLDAGKRKSPSYNKLVNGKLNDLWLYTDFGPGCRRMINFTNELKRFIEKYDLSGDKLKMIHINTVLRNILQKYGYDIMNEDGERCHVARYVFNDIGVKIVTLVREGGDPIWGRLADAEYTEQPIRWCIGFTALMGHDAVVDT